MTGRIGLFGGSFDPVHTGHLIAASAVRNEFSLDKVYFIPNYVSPFKTDLTISPPEHRTEMIRMSIRDNPYFEMSDFEITMKRSVYTYETVSHFKNIFPDFQLYLIIGYDCCKTIRNWKNFQHIQNNTIIVSVDRLADESPNTCDLPEVIYSKLCPRIDISSTMIRKMVSENFDIKYLVNDDVKCYIMDEKIYSLRENNKYKR